MASYGQLVMASGAGEAAEVGTPPAVLPHGSAGVLLPEDAAPLTLEPLGRKPPDGLEVSPDEGVPLAPNAGVLPAVLPSEGVPSGAPPSGNAGVAEA